MVYKQHNFYSNFMNAAGANSDSALRIFADEVAILAMYHRAPLEYALKNSGIVVPPNATKKQLISIVSDNLPDNETLRKSIAQLIVHRHQAQGTMQMNGGYSNAAGFGGSGAGSGALQGLMQAGTPADPVSAIASAVGGIAGAFRGSTDKKIAAEQTKQAMILALAQRQQQAAPPAKKMPTWAVVTLAVVGVAAVTGAIVFIVKRRNK